MTLSAQPPKQPNPSGADRQGGRSTGRRVLINTGALAGSSLWRIGLSFVLQLLIASRLGVEGLGQYATALAYLNVSQVLSELGLPQLLVRDLAQSPGQRRAIFWRALIMQVTAGGLIWLALLGITAFPLFTETTRLALLTVTASLPLFALTSVCVTLFHSDERMEVVMAVEMVINGLILAGSVALLGMGGGILHLTGLLVATQFVSALVYGTLIWRSGLLRAPAQGALDSPAEEGQTTPVAPESFPALWQRARPFYGLAITNVLLHRLDLLLLSAVAGEVITGIYSAAYLVVRVFLILSQTYWQALYPTLSRLRLQSADAYHRLAGLAIRYGLLALLPAAALISGLADPLLSLIFPAESYEPSVPVLRLLIWAVPLFLVTTYCINLLLIERVPRLGMLVAGVQISVTLALLPLLTGVWQAAGTGLAILLSVGVSSSFGLWLLRRNAIPAGLTGRLPLLLGINGGLAVGVALLAQYGPTGLWPLYGVGGGLLYAAILWRTGLLSPADLTLFRSAIVR